jgi:hypothetical protein
MKFSHLWIKQIEIKGTLNMEAYTLSDDRGNAIKNNHKTIFQHKISECLENRLKDGSTVVSLTHRPPFTPQEDSCTNFC